MQPLDSTAKKNLRELFCEVATREDCICLVAVLDQLDEAVAEGSPRRLDLDFDGLEQADGDVS